MRHIKRKPIIIFSSLLALIAHLDVTHAGTQSSNTYYALIYDFEVAQFCGLVNKKVHDAFRAKRKAIESQSEQTAEQLRKIRIGAMAAADIEYANRGLGGYKPWCQNEGRAGITRILTP